MSPLLSALVRPEPHLGDPVPATALDKIATGDHSAMTERPYETNAARAERLLRRIADFGETVMNDLEDPLDVPDFVLAAVTQAGAALVQLAALEGQQRGRIEVVLDGEGDLWVRVGDDEFECRSSHENVLSLEEIQDRFGVARTFVASPRPGD